MDGSTVIQETKVKIKYNATGLEEHVSNEIGKFAVRAGIATEVLPPIHSPAYAEVTWAVRDGAKVGDFLYPPEIFAKCSKCGTPWWQESQKGTAHLTMKFRHQAGCGRAAFTEQVPEHIAKEYLERWAKYRTLSRKKEPALTTTNSAELDRRLAKAVGYKTREELILEVKALELEAKKRR